MIDNLIIIFFFGDTDDYSTVINSNIELEKHNLRNRIESFFNKPQTRIIPKHLSLCHPSSTLELPQERDDLVGNLLGMAL
jgi:hypothetical protein